LARLWPWTWWCLCYCFSSKTLKN